MALTRIDQVDRDRDRFLALAPDGEPAPCALRELQAGPLRAPVMTVQVTGVAGDDVAREIEGFGGRSGARSRLDSEDTKLHEVQDQ